MAEVSKGGHMAEHEASAEGLGAMSAPLAGEASSVATASAGVSGPAAAIACVVEDPGAVPGAAARLSQRLGVPLEHGLAQVDQGAAALLVDGQGVSLVRDGMRLKGDLERMARRIRPDALGRELLVRAARIKGASGSLAAVDATAGLGEDALLLAAAGFSVTLCERDPVIAALLRDSLDRAAASAVLARAVERMRLVEGDSVDVLRRLDAAPDVVLLDPMFPGGKRAAAKKKLQLIQTLEAPCADEGELVAAAMAAGPRKVVIKRPAKGPWLAGIEPDYSLCGKAVRYDCLVAPRYGRHRGAC